MKLIFPLKPRNPGLSENYSFLIFSSKKVKIDNGKVVFLLELLMLELFIVIINDSFYNQAYIFLIIEL